MARPLFLFLSGRRCAVLASLLSFLGWPARLWAGDATPLTSFRGGGLTISVGAPTQADQGSRIDCNPGTDDCFLLNLAACTNNALPIQITMSQPLSQSAPSYVGGTQAIYAFLSRTASCIYSTNASQVSQNGTLVGTDSGPPSSSVYFSGGTVPFTFPTNLSTFNSDVTQASVTGTFTTTELMQAAGFCPQNGGTAVDLTPLYLCVGVDGSGNKGGVNNATSSTTSTTTSTTTSGSSSDLVGYLALQVDTSPPAAPTSLSVRPKNGRASATVIYDASLLNVYQVNVRYTADANDLAAGNVLIDPTTGQPAEPGDANATSAGCAAWTRAKSVNVVVRNDNTNERVINVPDLQNGKTYGFCAYNSDYLQNDGNASSVAYAMPRDECDLFECYDGTLRVGFCASQDLPALYSAAAIGCAYVAARRRRRRRGKNVVAWGACLIALWLPGAAQAAPDAAREPPFLQSSPPTDDPRNRPQSDAQNGAPRTEAMAPPVVTFGDPRRDSLEYGRPLPVAPIAAAEIAIGPYRPQIAHGAAAAEYNLIYGEHDGSWFAGRPLRYRVGGTVYPFAGWLTGPYASAGFWTAGGASRSCTAADGNYAPCTPQTIWQSQPGNDQANLYVVPLSVGWSYAFDVGRYTKVPVSVGVKGGLLFNLWWARNGGEPSRYLRGPRAQGHTANVEAGAFAAVDLNGFSARSRAMRQHLLLFAEYEVLPPGAIWGSDRAHRLSFGAPYWVTLGLRMHFLRERPNAA